MKNTILFCLSLLLFSCNEKKSNSDSSLFFLENSVYMDNYYIFRSNEMCYKAIETEFKSDTLKNDVQYGTAVKLNKINNELDNMFINIRHEFISGLKGNELFEADTLRLDQVVNRNDKSYTKEYYNNRFKEKLIKLEIIQKELNDLFPQNLCDLGSINEIWILNDLTAEEFIIRLTMTQNLLYKKINCLYIT